MGNNSSRPMVYPPPGSLDRSHSLWPTYRRKRYKGEYERQGWFPGESAAFPYASHAPLFGQYPQPQYYPTAQYAPVIPAPHMAFPRPQQASAHPVIPLGSRPQPGVVYAPPFTYGSHLPHVPAQYSHQRATTPMPMPQGPSMAMPEPSVLPPGASMAMPDPVIPPPPSANMSMPEPFIPGPVSDDAPVIPPMPDHPAYRGAQSTPYPRHVPELDPDYLNDEIRQRLQPELAPGQYGPSDPPRVRRRRRAASPPRPPNPLPHPPRNLFQGSPYLTVLQALHRPIDDNVLKASITSIPAIHTVHTIPPTGSRATRERKQRRGLFRSLSSRLNSRRSDNEPENIPPQPMAATMIYPVMQQMPDGGTALIYNPPLPQGMHVTGGVTSGVVPGVDPARGPSPAHSARASTPRPPAIKLDRENELAGLLHFSPHSVHYQRKTYPTALHLLEALKFLEHQPDLAERIRTCATPEQASEMAETFRQHVRPDWEQVFLHMIDEALYWKFMQHPYLRRLLMDTGQVDLVFSDSDDSFWGDGPLGQGANHLGNALMRVRQRLRAEGVHH